MVRYGMVLYCIVMYACMYLHACMLLKSNFFQHHPEALRCDHLFLRRKIRCAQRFIWLFVSFCRTPVSCCIEQRCRQCMRIVWLLDCRFACALSTWHQMQAHVWVLFWPSWYCCASRSMPLCACSGLPWLILWCSGSLQGDHSPKFGTPEGLPCSCKQGGGVGFWWASLELCARTCRVAFSQGSQSVPTQGGVKA